MNNIKFDIVDACGNCKEQWPCSCSDPVFICGICGADVYDCQCDERSYCHDYTLEKGD